MVGEGKRGGREGKRGEGKLRAKKGRGKGSKGKNGQYDGGFTIYHLFDLSSLHTNML